MNGVFGWIAANWLAVLITVFIFGFIIFIHEFGHFLMAKRVGVRVIEFSLGFGWRLFGIKRGDTDYNIKLFPLGGQVRLEGEDSTEGDINDSRNFQNRTFGEKMWIIVGGCIMNIVCAYLLFILVWNIFGGTGFSVEFTNKVGKVLPSYPAAAAGLTSGDEIIEINGMKVENGRQLMKYIHSNPDKKMVITVKRGSMIFKKEVTSIQDPKTKIGLIGFQPHRVIDVNFCRFDTVVQKVDPDSIADKKGVRAGDRVAGIILPAEKDEEERTAEPRTAFEVVSLLKTSERKNVNIKFQRGNETFIASFSEDDLKNIKEYDYEIASPDVMGIVFNRMTVLEATGNSLYQATRAVGSLVIVVQMLFEKKITGKEVIEGSGGPVLIVQTIFSLSKKGIGAALFIAAFINAAVGSFNLIPFPALDGSRLLFLIIGRIRRKAINQEAEGMIHTVGLVILVLLVVLITFKDIGNLIRGLTPFK